MPAFLKRHPVSTGFMLMFLCTWPVDLWGAANSHGWALPQIPPILPLLVGYGFVVAAVVMTGILDGRAGIRALLRQFLVWRVGLLWYGVVLLGPFAVDLVAVALYAAGGGVPDFRHPYALQIVGPSFDLWAVLPVFFLVGVFTNGEEIGWRGFALPRLQARHSALVASLVIGIVWALWHIPKFLTAGSAQNYSFSLYVVDTVAKAVLFTWVYNSTRSSLLTVTLLHAAMNTSAVFLPILPVAGGDVRPVLISMGLHCVVAVVVVVAAGATHLSRSREPAPDLQATR